MLTSYMVKCPYTGCDWFGSLLPRDNTKSWEGALPTVPEAVFECPRCHGQWHARVHGDEVEMLPLEETADALT
jgi:hypothetical protein